MINESVFEADHPDLTALPAQVQDAARNADACAPEVGQVWRLSWEGVQPRLALVLTVADCYTVVAPVTLEPEQRVDAALLLDESPLGVPVVVWTHLGTGLGDFALAECLGALASDALTAVQDRADTPTTETTLVRWNADLDEQAITARRFYRNRLISDFSALSDSDWNLADLFGEPDEYLDTDAAQAAGITIEALAEAVDLPIMDVYPVWQAEKPLPPGTAAVLSERIGQRAEQVIKAVGTDRDARAALDSPEFRLDIRKAAGQAHESESDTRRDLYRSLANAPGRETGGPAGQRDYRSRLRMLLDARLR